MNLHAVFGDWRLYNDLMVEGLRGMSDEELALRAPAADGTSSAGWPIWAIAGHTAGTRTYWLCRFMGVPGAEATPFDPNADEGWEDDLQHPRSAEELVTAWTSTWAVVEDALAMWAPEMLDEAVAGPGRGTSRHFTRRSLLMRMITHEGYHAGQIALIQGMHGRPMLDLWPPGYHEIEATAATRQY